MRIARIMTSALVLVALPAVTASAQSLDITGQADSVAAVKNQVSVGSDRRSTPKRVRNFIKEGNNLFNEGNFRQAEISYNKALELDPNSSVARYNLACALLRNSGNTDPNAENSPMKKAVGLLNELVKMSDNAEIIEKSFYNLGNVAFNGGDFGQSINMYKNALRCNPDNDKARENLRLAQLKQQENQNQDQDQDQQQEQQEQQQNQQQQQQQQNQDQQQQSQQPQMSDANAEKILKAMENEEAATRRRVEAQKAKEQNSHRRTTDKPW